jgi:hypothetical protein
MIIGVNGLKRSGKDELTKYLNLHYHYRVLTFADPVLEMICALLKNIGLNHKEILYYTTEEKEKDIPVIGISYRKLAQKIGTDCGRLLINEKLWVNIVDYKSSLVKNRNIVVSDVRYDNEAEWVKNRDGFIINVYRDINRTQDDHSSEQGIDRNLIDFYIENNSDNLYDLHKNIDSILSDIALFQNKKINGV